MNEWSARAQVVYRRTYSRPLEDGRFETWPQTVNRVIEHQRLLWMEAQRRPTNSYQEVELQKLRELMLARKVMVAGRTLWLGGTDIARRRPASQFNCSALKVQTINDLVDTFWLLLQGCGVGFKPVAGNLYGFLRPIDELRIEPSTRTMKGGAEANQETFDPETGEWRIVVGDSAEAWAKSLGKLVAHPYVARRLVLDFSQLRPAGHRLSGYGWISNGWKGLADTYTNIFTILQDRAGKLLTKIDILDIVNMLGTVLSSRRSAQIALLDHDDPESLDFIQAKRGSYWETTPWRAQSNNSIQFWNKPKGGAINQLLDMMVENGGSEPGIINAGLSAQRAPYYAVTNPCSEILLPDKGFCNLVTVDLAKFFSHKELLQAIAIISRANYRQTCVNFYDGVLQDQWTHANNALHLCGVSLTGQARVHNVNMFSLREAAIAGANMMAAELNKPKPALVTTVKPEGTLSKLMDTTEGIHKPLGKYIFNNINFNINDPLVPTLEAAGYNVMAHPTDTTGVIVTFPVSWPDVEFADGLYNKDSAVQQLQTYKEVLDNYAQHNVSMTVSYDPAETPEIANWLEDNWDHYIGTAFILRADPTKSAKDLGYLYLPQEVVTEKTFAEYVEKLKPINLEAIKDGDSTDPVDDGCATGACPVR